MRGRNVEWIEYRNLTLNTFSKHEKLFKGEMHYFLSQFLMKTYMNLNYYLIYAIVAF